MSRYRNLLVESGAIVEDHFVYNSGQHGRLYVNKTAGFVPVSHAKAFARAIADEFDNVEAVVGPELGAIALMAHVAAYLLDTRPSAEVYEVMATKIPGINPQEFEIARDQARFLVGKRVLLVEDILTQGINARGSVAAIQKAGGIIIGAGVLWNRGSVTAETIGVPKLFSLIDEPLQSYDEDDCPMCRMGVPVNTELGKGKQFLERKHRPH
ncbi:MAG: phosphoribosyltransferase [Patescibacteria group bacterium]